MSRAVDDNDKVSVTAVYAKDVQQEPIVKGLGIRANKVQISNESDCIKVKAKSWLDKKDWREIYDILGVQGLTG